MNALLAVVYTLLVWGIVGLFREAIEGDRAINEARQAMETAESLAGRERNRRMTDDDALADLRERSRLAVEQYLSDCDDGEFTDGTVGDLADCVMRWMAWRLSAEKEGKE